ncbi:MAG: hypothetical protein JNK30_02030 [Phenylobacterium sp.]|uniref:hypothetical protein n=1 Tax=Phenylobacterium sp. TaxID=1871053 RepID=UPI001A5398BD|nr:hypothetical protein [Phenylobacterium sp.]MBL8770134.1 hypothetical protein [Phenylobacterium sp.]
MDEDILAEPKKPGRRAGDADVLALAEGLLAAMGPTFDRARIEVLKDVAASYPDVGRDGAGEVVQSLDELLAEFLADEVYDRQAIAVHIRAWRFVVSGKPDRKERLRIMAGLADVRQHYAASRTA